MCIWNGRHADVKLHQIKIKPFGKLILRLFISRRDVYVYIGAEAIGFVRIHCLSGGIFYCHSRIHYIPRFGIISNRPRNQNSYLFVV